MTGQFQILDGSQAGKSVLARRFPFWIGRSAGMDLRLEDFGVWDRHLEIDCDPTDGFRARVEGAAIATLNGERFEHGGIRSGDELAVGSVRLRFWLPPARVASTRVRESLSWLGIAAVAFLEVGVAYGLGR